MWMSAAASCNDEGGLCTCISEEVELFYLNEI